MTVRQRYIADLYAFTRAEFPRMLSRPAFVRRWIHKLADQAVRDMRSYRLLLFRRRAHLQFYMKVSRRLNERLGQETIAHFASKEN